MEEEKSSLKKPGEIKEKVDNNSGLNSKPFEDSKKYRECCMGSIYDLEASLKREKENKERYYLEQRESGKTAVEGAGTHEATLTREIYIEKSDFSLDPPPKYHRLTVDGMVRLKGAYVIKYVSHETDENGNVTKVLCEYVPETMSGEANAGIKVKGVLHWAPSFAEDVVINDYDYLLDEIEDGRDFNDRLNPVTKVVYHGKAEAFLSGAKAQDKFQFMRLGYYVKNKKGEYNLIVGLKDSYKA